MSSSLAGRGLIPQPQLCMSLCFGGVAPGSYGDAWLSPYGCLKANLAVVSQHSVIKQVHVHAYKQQAHTSLIPAKQGRNPSGFTDALYSRRESEIFQQSASPNKRSSDVDVVPGEGSCNRLKMKEYRLGRRLGNIFFSIDRSTIAVVGCSTAHGRRSRVQKPLTWSFNISLEE